MKISPVLQPGTGAAGMPMASDAPQSMSQKIRSLKMKTNANPGYEEPPPEQNLNNPDTNVGNQETTTVAEDTQPLSPQFAALAKQRRALQQERQALDREKAEMSKSKDGWIDPAQLKSDPLGILLASGVTYENLIEAVQANNSGISPEVRALKDKVAALESGIDKRFTDQQTQAEQQALAEMRREATSLIAQGDDFEMVRETNSIPAVMRLIEQTYRQHGEVLDVSEALRLVEDELFKDNLRLAQLKKIQSQFAPAQAPVPPQQTQRQTRTLTNRDTASVPLSRKARAIAAFKGTLK